MAQNDRQFDCSFRFLSHEANSQIQALRARYEVRLIEILHEIEKDGWVLSESGYVISHAAQIRLVDALIEMVKALYEAAELGYFSAVGSAEYKEHVDLVERQLMDYAMERWRQLTRGLPLVRVDFDASTGTSPRSNEALLADALAAHIHSKALTLELQRWRTELAAQANPSVAEKHQSEPSASGPTAGMPRQTARIGKPEDFFLKVLDPSYLNQILEQFPELASHSPRLFNGATFLREMEAAKARAEIAFRRQESTGNWVDWDLDRDDIETQLDDFERSGAIYPWHPAGCEYVWELASAFLRATADDCKPQDFEALAGVVLDGNSDKVFEEKLSAYERPIWITSESAKARFKEYVRKRLDPQVRAACLDRWQQRLDKITASSQHDVPSNVSSPTQRVDSDRSTPADRKENPATILDAERHFRCASRDSVNSCTEPLSVTSIDGSVRWVNPESADLGASSWTPEDEKLISECVISGRAAVRSDLEVLFGSGEWPAAAALVASFRRYAVEVFDVYASAHQHAALSVESYQEALAQQLLPMVLGDLFGSEWARSPGEKVVRINWQIGEDRKSCGQEMEVLAANDPDPNCVYHELVKNAILHRYRFLEPPPSPGPGKLPGINMPDMNWWTYIGLKERHDLAMAIKPYLEDRIAHWQFVYSPTSPAVQDPAEGAATTNMPRQPAQRESGTVVVQTPLSSTASVPRKRGRPAKIDTATKEDALAVKASGGTGRDVAKVLYKTPYPDSQQVKNAPNILKHYLNAKSPSPKKS